MEIEIEIEIDWMRLPSGMRAFDFDFDSSVASRANPGPLFGCGLRSPFAPSEGYPNSSCRFASTTSRLIKSIARSSFSQNSRFLRTAFFNCRKT